MAGKSVVIEANENGPYLVKVDENVVTALCRCGNSNNKPYCDGTHTKTGFKAGKDKIKII